MPWSRLALAHVLIGLILAFELGVLWLAIHPEVPPDYRAYYIDQTTTCLNQPVAGDYTLGVTLDFTSDKARSTKPNKACGWQGPAGDGTHAVGETSRLRFVYAEPATALTLNLQAIAIHHPEHATQTVRVFVNGQALGDISIGKDVPHDFELPIPAAVVALNPGRVELRFEYPDAITVSPYTANTYKRSIKLLRLTLSAA